MLQPIKNYSLKCIVSSLTFLLCFFPNVFSSQPNNFENHSQLIYLLTRSFEWPPENKSGDFIIGVYNNDQAYESMQRVMFAKYKERQEIKIKNIVRIEDVKMCQILFLPDHNSANFDVLNDQAKKNSTLVMTQNEEGFPEGSCLNFYVSNGRLKFDLNSSEIEKRNIKIHAGLLDFIEHRE